MFQPSNLVEVVDRGQRLNRQQIELAERKIRDAEALDPDNPKIIKLKGELLSYSGNKEQAIDEFQLALRFYPDYVEALNSLGRTLYDLNRLQESEDAFKVAIELAPDNAAFITHSLHKQGKAAIHYLSLSFWSPVGLRL